MGVGVAGVGKGFKVMRGSGGGGGCSHLGPLRIYASRRELALAQRPFETGLGDACVRRLECGTHLTHERLKAPALSEQPAKV